MGYRIERGAIRWYTIGSKMTGGVEAGVFGPRTNYSRALGEYATIFQAEVYATIFQAEVYAVEECARFNLVRG